MAHIFRKYTSNRGSALFMVISTMTALFISCMAMYFSMVSARSSQYVVFNQMQANQSAMSISRIVGSALSDITSDLYQNVKDLKPGESITTDANGFKSLDPSVATGLDESQLGAYSVTITCTGYDENGHQIIDVMVISSVDGNRDSVHMSLTMGEDTEDDPNAGDDGSGGDAELFAATGYIPNDAYISGGYYLTDVFYDTQFTYMNTFGGSGENRIGQNLSTGGDLMLGNDAMSVVHSASNDAISQADVAKIGPIIWAIRGNFYMNLGNDMGVRGGSQFLVGSDLIVNNGQNMPYVKNDGYTGSVNLNDKAHDHVCIYVNGDFNSSGADLKANTWLFVNGNVTGIGNNAQNNAKIFVTGNEAERAAKTSTLNTSTPIAEWPKNGDFADGLTYDEAMKLLGQKTQTISYYKWDLSKNTEGAQKIDIRLNASNQTWTDKDGNAFDAYQGTYVIAYDKNATAAKLIKGNGGNELGVIGNSFVINSVQTHTDNNSTSEVIIIDTGDNPNNIMTIKLSDISGNGEFSWFADYEHFVQETWWPTYSKTEYEGFHPPLGMPNSQRSRMVLLMGRGTVLIDVPKGITYQDAGYQFTGHVAWWLLEGGKIEKQNLGGKEHITFSGVDPQGKYSAKIVPYIHKTCETGDGCTAATEVVETKCNECKGKLTKVSCTIHGDVNKYCASCHPELSSRTDWCKNHVDNKAYDTFYTTLSGENRNFVTDKNGKVYPTTNFMLVSCDESAEMRFSKLKSGFTVSNNSFFGFIYAPYMSYLAAKAAQAGGVIKLVGGMTVGDYDIQAIDSFIGCYPDKMPNELAGMAGGGTMSGGKLTGTSKSWKIKIGGYY